MTRQWRSKRTHRQAFFILSLLVSLPCFQRTTADAFAPVTSPTALYLGNTSLVGQNNISPSSRQPSLIRLDDGRSAAEGEETPNNGSDSSAVSPPPVVSRFFQALYKGLTFPFPTLRQLAMEDTSDKTAEQHEAKKQVGFSLREALLAIAVYLCLGAVSYHSTVVGNEWSFVDALYFSVVTFTTVGYGDLCPTTAFGKIFTILFGVSGISVLGIAIGTLGSRMMEIEENMVKKAQKASRHRFKAFWNKMANNGHHSKDRNPRRDQKEKGQSAVSKTSTSVDANGTTTTATSRSSKSVPLWKQTLKSIFTKSVPAFAVIILGGMAMGRVEGWPWMDSIYYAFITGVTLGYGDFSPITKVGRLWAIIFIPLAVAAAGEVLGNVATTLQERRQELFYESLMERELNVDRLLEMDTDHNGKVSREEYVEFMLKEMGLVSNEEFAELHEQFVKLDKDGSGLLDKCDLQERIDRHEEESGEECSI